MTKTPHRLFSTSALASVAMAAVSLVASPATAQEPWQYTGYLYLWGASIGGETVTGQDVEISFGDLLDNLDFALMGSLEARNEEWAIFGDAMYLAVSSDESAAFGPGIPVEVDADVQGFVTTLGAGYFLANSDNYRVNAFGGARYFNMDTTVNVAVGPGSRRGTDVIANWDAIVGVRGVSRISDRWDFVYYGDIGAGQSDLTWQAAVSFDYNIGDWALNFGYRHLSYDINNSSTLSEIEFSGPFVGAKYRF